MKKSPIILSMAMITCLFCWGMGCGSSGGGKSDDGDGGGGGSRCSETTLDLSVCDPGSGPFSLLIDNEFFPLEAGSQLVLEGEDDEDTLIRVEIDVLNDTEEVAGVTTRVVRETEYEDDELVEVSWNYFAQAPDGTVCYFGEDVNDYEDGEVVSNEGAWRAGENGNQAGIFMPADPQVGHVFSQEYAPGVAEDRAEIIAFGEEISVPAGSFDDTLTAEDCNPLEDDSKDRKVYVRGIGLAIDEDAELISY